MQIGGSAAAPPAVEAEVPLLECFILDYHNRRP